MKLLIGMAGEGQRRQARLAHGDAEFLVQLADQRIFGPLAVVELAAGKLPKARHRLAFRPLCDQHAVVGIDVSEPCLAPLTFASYAYDGFHLLMPLYICRRWEGDVTAREGQKLAWVRTTKLRDSPMPPADLPLIPHLEDLLNV